MFHSDAGNANMDGETTIKRTIRLMYPVATSRMKLTVLEDDTTPSLSIKMGFLGLPPKKKYDADPIFEEKLFENSKKEKNLSVFLQPLDTQFHFLSFF